MSWVDVLGYAASATVLATFCASTMISLRILALTDDEKREMRQVDDRTRGILERTEQMHEEQFAKLHGILRGLTPLKEETQ